MKLSSCISCRMPGCPILHKLQINLILPTQLNIPMNYGNCMCIVAFCIDEPSILYPKYACTLHITMKSTSKHPILLSLIFFHHTGRIPLFTSPSGNPGSGMSSTSNPYLISPQNRVLLLWVLCPVCMLLSPLKPDCLVPSWDQSLLYC